MGLDTANAARGRWPGILESLGVNPVFLTEKQGPCPICSGKTRFRYDDKLNGSWICNHCGAGDGFKLLQLLYGWDFKKAASEFDRIVGNIPVTTERKPERSDEDKADMADEARLMRQLIADMKREGGEARRIALELEAIRAQRVAR